MPATFFIKTIYPKPYNTVEVSSITMQIQINGLQFSYTSAPILDERRFAYTVGSQDRNQFGSAEIGVHAIQYRSARV